MRSKPTFKPCSKAFPLGSDCQRTDGSHWSKRCIDPIVPLVLALYGHPHSGGLWEKRLEDALGKQGFVRVLPEIWTSIFHHPKLDLLLVVYVDEDLPVALTRDGI